jgi:hypothetical protein
MKLLQTVVVVLFAISLHSCKKDKLIDPPCLQAFIDDINAQNCAGDAKIDSYTFQGELVYTIEPGFCYADQAYLVINSKCDTIGWLGGLIGNININGEVFYEKAQLEGTIWKR